MGDVISDQHISLFIICKDLGGMESTIKFLRRRDWDVSASSNPSEAIKYVIENKPQFLMVSMNHPNSRVRNLPRMLGNIFTGTIIPFAEKGEKKAIHALQKLNSPYAFFPPVAGPSVERRIRSILLQQERQKNQQESLLQNNGPKGKGKDSATIRIQGDNQNSQGSSSQFEFNEKISANSQIAGPKSSMIQASATSQLANSAHGHYVPNGENSTSSFSAMEGSSEFPSTGQNSHQELSQSQFEDGSAARDLNPQNEEFLGQSNSDFQSLNPSQSKGEQEELERKKLNYQKALQSDTPSSLSDNEKQINTPESFRPSDPPGESLSGLKSKGQTSQSDSPGSFSSSQVSPSTGSEYKSKRGDLIENNSPISSMGTHPHNASSESPIKPPVAKGSPENTQPMTQNFVEAAGEDLQKQKDIDLETCLELAIEKVVDAKVKGARKLKRRKHLQCLMVESKDFCGYLVSAFNGSIDEEVDLINQIRNELYRLLKDVGYEINKEEWKFVKIKSVDFNDWIKSKANFFEINYHDSNELSMAFFHREALQIEFKNSPLKDKKLVLDLKHVTEDSKVSFDLYVYLPKNTRYYKLLSPGSSLSEKRHSRITLSGFTQVAIDPESRNLFKEYLAQSYFNESIQSTEGNWKH